MGDIHGNGNYVDCKRTMKVDEGQCPNKFQQYVNMNPCDTARSQAWNEFQSSNPATKETGRLKMDFFVYSVCEQGEYP